MKYLSDKDVRELLDKACEKTGGQRAWTRLHGLETQSGKVSEVINGIRPPTPGICRALGLEKMKVYRRKS